MLRLANEKELQKLLSRNPDLIAQGGIVSARTPPNKLGAIKTQLDGYQFDSKLEARRYQMLRRWEAAGLIRDLDCEHKRIAERKREDIARHKWTLQEKFIYNDKTVRAITYTDDFQYVLADSNLLVVEDVKSKHIPASSQRTLKMFRKRYPEVHFFLNFSVDGWYQDANRRR